MMHQNDYHPALEEGSQLIYLACSPEDLIAVEMDAWACGFRDAGTVSASPEPGGMRSIEQTAELVCEQALQTYIPLDLDRFRDVFVRAWCAGYCTGLRRTDDQQQRQASSADPENITH
jgi:hypothetical protein